MINVHFPIRATGQTSEMLLRKRERGALVRFEFRFAVTRRFIDACSASLWLLQHIHSLTSIRSVQK